VCKYWCYGWIWMCNGWFLWILMHVSMNLCEPMMYLIIVDRIWCLYMHINMQLWI
jgi:hypothetical protein